MLFAGSVFLIGALSAAVGGFSLALSTYAVYSGVIGIPWVSYWGAWAALSFQSSPRRRATSPRRSSHAAKLDGRSRSRRVVSGVLGRAACLRCLSFFSPGFTIREDVLLASPAAVRPGRHPWRDAVVRRQRMGLVLEERRPRPLRVPIILLCSRWREALCYVWLCLRLDGEGSSFLSPGQGPASAR